MSAKKLFKNAHQLRQLRRLDPPSYRAALVAIRGGFLALASEITRDGMLRAFDRLVSEKQPPAQTTPFDLVIATKKYGVGLTSSASDRILWWKEAGKEIE